MAKLSKKINEREVVLSILMDVEKNKTFSSIAIAKGLKINQFSKKEERSFINRLAQGVIENKIRLDYIINQFSKTPINKCKPLIRTILRMGVYQILYMDSVPDTAACDESVKLTKNHGFNSLSGFVNGVLRNIVRNQDSIVFPEYSDYKEYLSVKYSVNKDILEVLIRDYKNFVEVILDDMFREKMTSIRLNNIDEKEFTDKIKEKDINFIKGSYSSKAIKISGYDYIKKIPGYYNGNFIVQDESSMVAIELLDIKKNDLILDLCAAPGGKTTYAATFVDFNTNVLARDISQDKIDLIQENIERLKIENIFVEEKDATIFDDESVAKYDIVIADIPCSGLGIMGRKNDIKYRLTKDSFDEIVELQRKILKNAALYVKSGGKLLFSTCTINKMENQENLKWFLEENPEFQIMDIPENIIDKINDIRKQKKLDDSFLMDKNEKYLTFIQGIDDCDGFFISILGKR